jgi:hypothetical protein
MEHRRHGVGLPALALWMLLPLSMAAAVYVLSCVPLVRPPLTSGCSWEPDADVPLVPILEYGRLWLYPPGPLTGAT